MENKKIIEKIEKMIEKCQKENKVTLGYATLKEARDYGYYEALTDILELLPNKNQ